MKSTVEVLREARALIDTPEKWTKGNDATDASGEYVPIGDRRACRFCATGALLTASGGTRGRAYEALKRAMGVKYLMAFNDREETTHADVLAAFDRAIEAEDAKS